MLSMDRKALSASTHKYELVSSLGMAMQAWDFAIKAEGSFRAVFGH
jgi:hypothetical protein